MLEALGRRKAPHNRIAGLDLVEILAHLAQALRREVGVFLDRGGGVTHVIVSRRWQPAADALRQRSGRRASGLRYVEAHPHPDGRPDEGDVYGLGRLDLDLVATVGTSRGRPTELWLLGPAAPGTSDGTAESQAEGPYPVEALVHLDLEPRLVLADAARRRGGATLTGRDEPERAVMVLLERPNDPDATAEELARLVDTAGGVPVATVIQRRARPDPARFLGRGKVEEVLRATETYAADLVVVDEELSPLQQRNLEQDLGVKVLDRTALVLDIFARRARSREGRLQVELAQNTYLLPRLAGRGVWLSRLGGGIGTRGPGETKLEVDRRRLRSRITALQREIDAIQRHRRRQHEPRSNAAIPQVALVGYTNSGKSTLLNALTGAGVLVEDRLFATLDPTIRRVVLPNRRAVVLADTVGFIQRLPTKLVAAFRGTLEEAVQADLLVHVVDASHPAWPVQARVVREVLASIGAGDRPCLTAFNKADLLSPAQVRRLQADYPDAVVISAARGDHLPQLLAAIARHLPDPWVRIRMRVPYRDGRLLARIQAEGRLVSARYDPEGADVVAEVPGTLAVQLRTLVSYKRRRSTAVTLPSTTTSRA